MQNIYKCSTIDKYVHIMTEIILLAMMYNLLTSNALRFNTQFYSAPYSKTQCTDTKQRVKNAHNACCLADGKAPSFFNNLTYLLTCVLVFVAIYLNGVSSSFAGNVTHVNIGRVEVSDQSLGSQRKAGKLALEQVFVKLSGNVDIATTPQIAKAIENYEQFLVASSFTRQNSSLFFEANFNQEKVQQLLLSSGKNVWASLRPSALLWLVLQDNQQQKQILSQDTAMQGIQTLAAKAFERGVEVVVPLGDLDDTMNVSVYDIWNQYISNLQRSSVRYQTDYIISATIQALNENQPDPNGYTHKLDYIVTNADINRPSFVKSGYLYAKSEDELLKQLVDEYANILANEFASSGQSELPVEYIELTISGVVSLQDYVHIMGLIESFPAVQKVRFVGQTDDVAKLLVEQKMSVSQLTSILLLDSRFSAQISERPDLLSFRWQSE